MHMLVERNIEIEKLKVLLKAILRQPEDKPAVVYYCRAAMIALDNIGDCQERIEEESEP